MQNTSKIQKNCVVKGYVGITTCPTAVWKPIWRFIRQLTHSEQEMWICKRCLKLVTLCRPVHWPLLRLNQNDDDDDNYIMMMMILIRLTNKNSLQFWVVSQSSKGIICKPVIAFAPAITINLGKFCAVLRIPNKSFWAIISMLCRI